MSKSIVGYSPQIKSKIIITTKTIIIIISVFRSDFQQWPGDPAMLQLNSEFLNANKMHSPLSSLSFFKSLRLYKRTDSKVSGGKNGLQTDQHEGTEFYLIS